MRNPLSNSAALAALALTSLSGLAMNLPGCATPAVATSTPPAGIATLALPEEAETGITNPVATDADSERVVPQSTVAQRLKAYMDALSRRRSLRSCRKYGAIRPCNQPRQRGLSSRAHRRRTKARQGR